MIRLSHGQEYVVEPADAVSPAGHRRSINEGEAGRLQRSVVPTTRVKQGGYSGPWFRAEEQDQFLTSAELVNFVEGEPPEAGKVILPPPSPRGLEEESPF